MVKSAPADVDELLGLSRPMVVFDTETTGTIPSRDRIVEIACVKIHPGGRREVLLRRVNPGVPIPEESARIHGIRDADVAALPRFCTVAADVATFLSGCDLAGYNIERFDLPLLQFEFERCGVDFNFNEASVIDSQMIFFNEEGRTLSHAMRFYVGAELENAHSALADAEATARVLAGQLQKYGHLPRSVESLAAHYRPKSNGKIDPEGKLLLRDDVAYVNFGRKHFGKSFDQVWKEEPHYFDWILKGDFSMPIKRYVAAYLERVKPKLPMAPAAGR